MRVQGSNRVELRNPWGAPWTVWAYGIQLPIVVAYGIVQKRDAIEVGGGLLLELAILAGLFYGVRVAWLVAMLFTGIGLLGSVFLVARMASGDENLGVGMLRVSLVLWLLFVLVHPRTLAWTRRP